MFEAEKKALDENKCVCSSRAGVDKEVHEGCAICPNREIASSNVLKASGAFLYRDNHPSDTDIPTESHHGVPNEEE